MRVQVVLLFSIIAVSCGLANGNWLSDIIRGVSEGMQDAYKKGKNETKLKEIKQHLEKRIAEHPKFKHHKEDLHNVIKKAEKHLKKLHRKFEKLYQTGDAKKAKDKQMKAIKKWMSSLTKINTDGEAEHGIPFIPKILTHEDVSKEHREKKAEQIFKSLAKMWEEKAKESAQGQEKVSVDVDQKKKPLLGKDEKIIQPKFVNTDFEKLNMFGKDSKEIIPEFVKEEFDKGTERRMEDKDELKKLHKIDILGKDEKDIMPDFVKKEFENMKKKEMLVLRDELQKGPVFTGDEKNVQFLGESDKEKTEHLFKTEKVKKDINKESEDLEKTVEELIPFLGKEKNKNVPENPQKDKAEIKKPAVGMKTPEKHILTTFVDRLRVVKVNPANSKSLDEVQGEEDESEVDEKEEEMMSTKEKFAKEANKRLKDAEDRIIAEENEFAEAEKKWEEEIRKKAAEEIQKEKEKESKKTTEEEEIEEDLHEPTDTTFTPPDDVQTTTEPLVQQEAEKPLLTFDFDDKKEFPSDKQDTEKEQIFPLPRRVLEPASLFATNKNKGSAFEEMSEDVKPFFQKLDDSNFRQKFLNEEKQWMAIEKWAVNRLYGKKGEKLVK